MTSSQESCCGHRHMCFIYSSSFTAVTQSSMARAVCRQMWLISPQLSFKGQLTACPGGLVGMLWAQLNHRDRKMLPQNAAAGEGGRSLPCCPPREWTVIWGCSHSCQSPDSRLKSPLRAPFITSWEPLNQGKASLWQLYPAPATGHNIHGVMSTPALSTGAHNNS